MDQENLIEPEYYQRTSKPHRSSILKTINTNVFSDDKARKNENKRISFANNIFFQEILADGTTRVFEEPEPEKLTSPVKRPVDDMKDLSTDISIEIDSKKSKRRKFLPKSIAITYDIDDGGDKNTVYNTFANAHLSENDIEIEMHKWLQSKPMELTNIDTTNDSRCSNDNMLMATRYDSSIMSNFSQEMDISLEEEQLEDSVFESTFYNMNDSAENSLSIEKKKDFSFQSENMPEEGKIADDVSMLKSYLLDQVEEKFNCHKIKLDQNDLSREQIYSGESQETFENKNEYENTDLSEKKMDLTSLNSMQTEFGMKTCYETLTMEQTKVETNSLSGYMENKTSERPLVTNQMSTENIKNNVNSESSKEIPNNDRHVSNIFNDSPTKDNRILDENERKEENSVIESLCPKNISLDDSNEKENIDPKNKSMILNDTSMPLDLSFDLKASTHLKQASNSPKNIDAINVENKSIILENRKEIEKIDMFANSQLVYNKQNESFKRDSPSIHLDENVNESDSLKDFRKGATAQSDTVKAFKNEVNQEIKSIDQNIQHHNTNSQDILQSENINNNHETDIDHQLSDDANLIEMSLGQTNNFSFINRSNQTFFEDKINANDKSTISLSKLDLSLRPQLTLPSPSHQQSTTQKNTSLLKPGSFLFCNTKTSAKFSNPFASASIKWPGRHNDSSKNFEVRPKATKEVLECSKIDISSVFTPHKPVLEIKKDEEFLESRNDHSAMDLDKNGTGSLSMFLHQNLDQMFDSKTSKSITNQEFQSPKNGSFTLEMPLDRSFSFVEYDSSNEESILSCVSPSSINNSKSSKTEFEELAKQNYELSVQEMPLEQSFSFVEYGSSEVSDLSLKNVMNEENDLNSKNVSLEKWVSNLKNSYKDLEENCLQNIFKPTEESSTKCLNSASIVSSHKDHSYVAKCMNDLRETNSDSQKIISSKILSTEKNIDNFVNHMSPMVMKNEKSQTIELRNNALERLSLKHDEFVETSVLENVNFNNDHYAESISNSPCIPFEKSIQSDTLNKDLNDDMAEKIPCNISEKNSTVLTENQNTNTMEEFEALNDMTKIDNYIVCVDGNKVDLKQENMNKKSPKSCMNETNHSIDTSKKETISNSSTQNKDNAKDENVLDSQDATFKTLKSLDNEPVSFIKSIFYEKSKQDDDEFSRNTSKTSKSDFEKTMFDQSELMTKDPNNNNHENTCEDNVRNKSSDHIDNKEDDITKNTNKILSITLEGTLKINYETSNNSAVMPLLSSNPKIQNEVSKKEDFDFKQNFNESSNFPLDLSKKKPSNHENAPPKPLKTMIFDNCENVYKFKSLSSDTEIKQNISTKVLDNINCPKSLKIYEALDCRINVVERQDINVNENNLHDFQKEVKHDICKTIIKDTFDISKKSEMSNEMIVEQMLLSPKSLKSHDDASISENEKLLAVIPHELKENSKDHLSSRNVLSSYFNEKESENLFHKPLIKNTSIGSLNASIDVLHENKTTNIKTPEQVDFNETKKENFDDISKVETSKEVDLSCDDAFTMCVDLENAEGNNSIKTDSKEKYMNEVLTYTNNDKKNTCIDEEIFPHMNTKDQDIPQVRNVSISQNLSSDKNYDLCLEYEKIEMNTIQRNDLSLINYSDQEVPIYKECALSISTKSHFDPIDTEVNNANDNTEISVNLSKSASDHNVGLSIRSSNENANNSKNIDYSNIHSSNELAVNHNTTTLSRFLQGNLTQNTQEMPSEVISPELRHKSQNISISDVFPMDKWFSFVEYDSPELLNSTIPPHSKTRDSLSCFLNAWSKSNNQDLEQSESNDTSNETNLDLDLFENSLSGYFERDDTYSPSMLDITRWSISDECDGNENSLFELREEFEKNMDSYLSEDNKDGLTCLLMNDEPSFRMLPGDLGKYENNCVKIDFNEAVFDFSCANFRIYLEFSNNDLTISRMKWVCRVDEIGKRGFIQIRNGRHEMIRIEEKALIGMYKLAMSNEFKNLINEMNRSKYFELLNLLERIDKICHKCENLMIEVRHIVRYRGAKFIKYINGVYKWIYWIIGVRKPIYVCLSIDPRNYPNDYIVPEFWFPKEDRILYSSEIYQQAMLMEKPGDHTYIRRLAASTEKFIKFWKKHLIHLFD